MDENDFDNMFDDMEQDFNDNMQELHDELEQIAKIDDAIDDDFFAINKISQEESTPPIAEPGPQPSSKESKKAFAIPNATTDDFRQEAAKEEIKQETATPNMQQADINTPGPTSQPEAVQKSEYSANQVMRQQAPVNPRRVALEHQQAQKQEEAPIPVKDFKQSAKNINNQLIASQGSFNQENTYENQQAVLQNTSQNNQPLHYPTENDQNNTNIQSIDSKGLDDLKSFCKKAAVFFIALIVIVGIPIILFKSKEQNKPNTQNNPSVTPVTPDATNLTTDDMFNDWSDPFDYYDLEPSTGTPSESITQEKITEATSETSSSRFNTLDELTAYIQSNQGVILSTMQLAEIQLQNEEISHEQYISQMNTYIAAANELNNLLLANASVYSEEQQQDTYNNLVQSMNTVIVYGATAITK